MLLFEERQISNSRIQKQFEVCYNTAKYDNADEAINIFTKKHIDPEAWSDLDKD